MRFISTGFVLFMVAAVAVRTSGGEIPVSLHEFCGSGSANVFDGGPVVEEAFCNTGGDPDVIGGGFLAVDRTSQQGVFGAEAKSKAGSTAMSVLDGTGLSIIVELNTIYRPSEFPGGDNPGGMAVGEFMSVIEFHMVADEMPWNYFLTIDEDSPFFEGSTSIIMENVTQSLTILELTSEAPFVETTLSGHTGDLIRITSMMEGAGNMGPGSRKEYEAVFQMLVLVPEPGTLLLLLTGALMGMRK